MPEEYEAIIEIIQPGEYCYTYSDRHEPVARVQPGQRVAFIAWTVLAIA